MMLYLESNAKIIKNVKTAVQKFDFSLRTLTKRPCNQLLQERKIRRRQRQTLKADVV